MKKVLIRGGGDLATAVIQKLHRSGFDVLVKELDNPRMVRRNVSISNAIYEGEITVEDVRAKFVKSMDEVNKCLDERVIPVVTIDEQEIFDKFKPDVFIDATLRKKPSPDYSKDTADIVIALGPSIVAGKDADVVIETNRGHDLARIIFEGKAEENTHEPGNIAGFTSERVLRAPCDGQLEHVHKIGDLVKKGEVITRVNGQDVCTVLDGVVRGLIHPSVKAHKGLKLGDVDPRGNVEYVNTISEKGRNIAGGVLEAILILSK